MITEISAHSGKLGIYVEKIKYTIPTLLDVDVSMGVGVRAIDPGSQLKNLLCKNDTISNVNEFDSRKFTRRKMVKVLTDLAEGERKIPLHRRGRVCEARVRVDENINYIITHAISPCKFVKQQAAESMIIREENRDVKYRVTFNSSTLQT